jgi:2-methylisocitrate lyase-like PEP mutase family enzyme
LRGRGSAAYDQLVTDVLDRRARFHALHQSGCFVIPNPWDAGSARLLAGLGFKALATTSSGFAFSSGGVDVGMTLDATLAHLREIAGSVDLPVSADFREGFAVEPDQVAVNVLRAADTGIAGLSIEDSTGNPDAPLFDFDLAVERIRAARQALDRRRTNVVLTARSEGFIAGRPDMAETIRRLQAYAQAGADCLFAPGLRSRDQISAIVDAVSPAPVNVLVSTPFITVGELASLGVRRISVGGALSRAAWTGLLAGAREIAERGTFTTLGSAASFADLNALAGPPIQR